METVSPASSAAADKSQIPAPPAIMDLAKLLARLAASEIILSGGLAKRVLDASPFSSETGTEDGSERAAFRAGNG